MKILVNTPLVRMVTEWLAVVGLYVVSAQIVPHTNFAPESSTPLWPPAAIAVAAGLVLGYRSAIGVWIGSLLVNYGLLSGPYASATALAVATRVTFQLLAVTMLLRMFVPSLFILRVDAPD